MYISILQSRLYSCKFIGNTISYKHICTSVSLMQLKWKRVQFNAVSANLDQLPNDTLPRDCSRLLRDSAETWKQDGKRSMWLKVPVEKSYLIPAAFKNGFEYHHAEKNYAMLFKWLPDQLECKVPVYATHHVGVSGLVLNEDSCEALLVQDKKQYKIGSIKKSFWKFPGGLSDQGENIGSTAEREIFEETGVKSKFQSILLFRQQHEMKSTFKKSDIYVVCRMKPVTYDLILCDDEIVACQWLHLDDIISHPDTTPLTKVAAKLALSGIKYGFEHFDITFSEMRSWVDPSKTFFIYHQSMDKIDSLRVQQDHCQ